MKPLAPESSPGPLEPNENQHRIEGGFILLARKMSRSGIMEKPPLFIKLWIWMLCEASYKDHGNLRRGQFFTSLEKMRKTMAYKVGYRAVKPSIKEIRGITKFLTKNHMVVTTKVSHGMLITIQNYEIYQDWKNYEGHNEGQDEGHIQGTLLTKKGRKKGINKPPLDYSAEIDLLMRRYSAPEIIDQALAAIRSTRKSGEVSDSILLAQFRKWARYPVEQVEAGISTYLKKDCAGQGKDERYLLGIIRNLQHQKSEYQIREEPVFKSTGSALLDEVMRNPEKWKPVNQ